MWKTVALCASLFGGAALGLALVARWIEPTALPATAAIGLCLIGVVLILAAPPPEMVDTVDSSPTIPVPTPRPALLSNSSGRLKAIDVTAAITPSPDVPAPVEKLL
jgi:hypothetical protein